MHGWAFTKCVPLTVIMLPPNLTKIGQSSLQSAFNECTSLSEIALPPNLAEIAAWTFYGCISLSVHRHADAHGTHPQLRL